MNYQWCWQVAEVLQNDMVLKKHDNICLECLDALHKRNFGIYDE